MKLRKVLLASLILILTIALAIIPTGNVFATVATTTKYLGITEIRTNSTPNMGYAIGDPNTNQETGNAAKIWNIVEYASSTGTALKANGSQNLYCLKAGVGFTDTEKRVEYDLFYDMKTERDQMKAKYDVLKSIVEGTITLDDKTVINKYDALLALGDMLYLHGETEEQKTAYLNAAQISEDDYSVLLTDDDIAAVQQAAIWYFTNYHADDGVTHEQKYDKLGNSSWLYYTLDGNTYQSLSGYKTGTKEGVQRQQQAETLYKYLITTAKQNAKNYTNSETLGAPAKVNTKTLNYEESGDNYIVGPINITEQGSTIPYTIDFVVKNSGTAINDYKLLNSQKTEVSSGTTVKDLVGSDFYISVPKSTAKTISITATINYSTTKLTAWVSTKSANEQPILVPEKVNESVPVELTVTPNEQPFDLALRKYITKVNGVELTGANSRVPSIDESTLKTGTTATYKHRKDPLVVKNGDKVTYKLTIYNEGQKAGRALEVVDQLPTGLKFSKVVSGNFELGSYNETGDNTLTLTRKASNTDNLLAYVEGTLSSETIEIECEVTQKPDTTNKKILTNVAWISKEYDSVSNLTITNQTKADRDSEPATKPSVNKDNMENYTGSGNKEDLTDSNYYYKGQQDDDDFEKLVLIPESFDLKLIKRIVAVNNQNVPERIEKVDVSKLNTIDENGKLVTTGDYTLSKDPVGVKKGDIVTYTFRVYNEGTINGYAKEITEDIPEGLQFLWSEKEGDELQADTTLSDEEKEAIDFNQKYLWGKFQYDEAKENIIQISTDYLSKEQEKTPGANLIEAFGSNDGTKTEKDIHYKEVSVKMKVISDNVTGTTIRNEACISNDSDKDGNEIDDRDSKTDEWKKYEDDEDYDNIILQSFDLALRKFIIATSKDETIEDNEYLKNEDGSYKRAPVVDTSKLNTKDENEKLITTAIYNHTKEPVLVNKNDIVVYMLRVYNEGEIDGYAAEIKDHLPSNLEFVEGDFNNQYGWTVSEDGRTVTTKYLENAKINKAVKNENPTTPEKTYTLSYKEVPIMCKVKDTAKTNENITNIADITKYEDENKNTVTDRDSQSNNVNVPSDKDLPGYKDNEKGDYVPGQEDDDDFEKVIVKEFDLALRKWVTQAIVIDKKGQTVTNTGHQPYDDPEQVVKVELNRKKLNEVTVKFKYSIRVINEGDIAGYAKEVTDYIPEGLKFVAADNPGWTDKGNNVITTRLLENTLLQPGEFADVEVTLTWINNQDNMGLKVNTAEISEDYNDYNVPDRDSTPNNKKTGEDDIDDAPVMLSVSTGKVKTYFTLGFVVLITVAGGVVLIKKFVL